MQPIPVPSAEEARANQCFETLLWSLSRPGLSRRLPQSRATQVVDALIDRECRVYASDKDLADYVRRSGAELVAIEEADHVFMDTTETSDWLCGLSTGSDLYPDDGATLIIPAKFGEGQTLRMSGPGIKEALDLKIGRLPSDFFALRERLIRYPMGFDIFLMDEDRVIGIPRSTNVEVL